MKYQKGFTHLLMVVLLVTIVAALGFTGYLVVTKHKTNLTQSPPTNYLVIKEWGLEIPISGAISDAYYEADGQGVDGTVDQIGLSVRSLKNTQCKAGGWPPSIYFRFTATDADPVSGVLYTKNYPNAPKIGDYYYTYGKGLGVYDANIGHEGSGCQSTVADQTLADRADAAFKVAFKSLRAVSQ